MNFLRYHVTMKYTWIFITSSRVGPDFRSQILPFIATFITVDIITVFLLKLLFLMLLLLVQPLKI